MDPVTMIGIGKTLLDAGPSLLRGIGRMFGGKTAEVVDGAANIVDAVRGAKNPEQEITRRLEKLPPEDLAELERVRGQIEVELERIAMQREANQLNAETTRHGDSQQTIRTEAEHGTDYVKNTRPRMARLSGYAMAGYVLVAEAANLISQAWGGPDLGGASVAIAGVLFSPCGTYMTMRTFDGFSKAGKG